MGKKINGKFSQYDDEPEELYRKKSKVKEKKSFDEMLEEELMTANDWNKQKVNNRRLNKKKDKHRYDDEYDDWN